MSQSLAFHNAIKVFKIISHVCIYYDGPQPYTSNLDRDIRITMPRDGPAAGIQGCNPSYAMEAEYYLWQKQRHKQYLLDLQTNSRARYFLHYYWYLHNLHGHTENAGTDTEFPMVLRTGPREVVGHFLGLSPNLQCRVQLPIGVHQIIRQFLGDSV